jgi:hypothetical protein
MSDRPTRCGVATPDGLAWITWHGSEERLAVTRGEESLGEMTGPAATIVWLAIESLDSLNKSGSETIDKLSNLLKGVR